MVTNAFLSQSYDAFGRIEEQFNEDLDQTLSPRGPEMLYERSTLVGQRCRCARCGLSAKATTRSNSRSAFT